MRAGIIATGFVAKDHTWVISISGGAATLLILGNLIADPDVDLVAITVPTLAESAYPFGLFIKMTKK